MATARLTRVVEFSAAHRYYRPDWTPEQNATAFGACANEHGHGHAYRCSVTVSGDVAPATQAVVDLAALDRILRDEITARFDHRHLNYDVPEFAFGKTIPTTEALAMHVWHRVQPRLPAGVTLHRVRVQEEPHLYADYFGPD